VREAQQSGISQRVNAPTNVQRSLADLEWPEVCAAISRHCLSDLGIERAHELSPVEDQETAELRLSVMREVISLRSEGATLPAGSVRDVGESVARASREGMASAVEMSQIARLLRIAGELDRFGSAHLGSAPQLGRVLTVSEELPPLLRLIQSSVDDLGEVLDDASEGLARARAQVRGIRGQVKKRLEELIRRYREALQDGYYAERDGRYVLPVRADAPFRVDGIVLDTSASGSTLYVEPSELGQLGNQLRLAEMEVQREISVILARLSAEVAPLSEEILWAQDVAVRADLLRACGEFAGAIGARVVEFGDSGAIDLVEARHPLLCLSEHEVVPSDLSLSPDKGLVLSGPNAGGKTVGLKTLGLLALMQASGLPVPAHEDSRIGFFSEVLSDIGDDQSLSMSLSTFSGHVERVRAILDESGHGTLVLFDELMGGTDPDEGAVLAIATIDALVAVGAAVCVTTHYEPLKEHAARASHLENGAVGFDFDRMAPTYVVEMGRPGASSAIIVAERHGLPKFVTTKALSLMPSLKAQKREESIQMEGQAVRLKNEEDRLRTARQEQERLNRQLAMELEKQREARRRDLARESDELRAEVRAARAEIRRIRTETKKSSATELRKMETQLDRAASVGSWGGQVDRELKKPASEQPKEVEASSLVVGARVKVRGFDVAGEVLEKPKKGHVRVLLGVMKMNVALADIEGGLKKQKASPAPQMKRKQKLPEFPDHAKEAPVRSEDITLDLRGQRVEDSLALVDHFVDELLRRQEMGGFVLHGHGTGALKEAVRQHLRAHSCISLSRPAERDEGGDAFTILWLHAG